MSDYGRWLENQLRHVEWLDKHPEPQRHHNDELRDIIGEARQRAAVAGLPNAVHACEIRTGSIAPNVAREILAACLGEIEPADDDAITVKQAAEILGVSTDKVYDLAKEGRLAHKRIGRTIRFRPADLEAFQQDSTQAEKPLKLRYL
jgi:excisionase family DNA binding protein